MKKITILFVVALMALSLFGCGEDDSSDSGAYSLLSGDLVSAQENQIEQGNVLVIKAKIESSYNNESTVNQNYHNVEDLILNQGCDKFDEIQYWAVADMTDGSEEKVISFTVDSETIKGITERNIAAIQLGDYVSDLWIHPSLQQ